MSVAAHRITSPFFHAKTIPRIQVIAAVALIKAPSTHSILSDLTSLSLLTSHHNQTLTMASTQPLSAACCSIPPTIAENYQHKGTYQTIGGLRTYTTGPVDATHGILMISDVFGFFPQTLQGADILAYADERKPYRVFMPDWFDGEPMPIEWYPPDTEEKKVKLGKFFETKAEPQTTMGKIPGAVQALRELAPGVQAWGFLGLCWGAKVRGPGTWAAE